MKERLDLLMKAENLNAGRLADMIGVQRSGISHILTGRNKPGFDFIVNLLQRFPRVNPNWLLLGQGDMYNDVKTSVNGITTESSARIINMAEPDIFSSLIPNNYSDNKHTDQPQVAKPKSISSKNAPETLRDVSTQYQVKSNSESDVERVIILKKDGTFISYTPGK